MASYIVVESDGKEIGYQNVNIRVTHEGCLQILGTGNNLYVTYSSAGWLKCWRVEEEVQSLKFDKDTTFTPIDGKVRLLNGY